MTSSETIQLGCKLAVYYFWGKQKTLRKLGNLITCNLGWSNEKCWFESDELTKHFWLREINETCLFDKKTT